MTEQANRDEPAYTSDLINATGLGVEQLHALSGSALRMSLRRLIDEVGLRPQGYIGFDSYLDVERYIDSGPDDNLIFTKRRSDEDGTLT